MTETLLVIFLPILIAYTLVKIGYLNRDLDKTLKIFVMRVTVPASIFIAIYNTDFKTLKQIIPLSSSYILLTALLIVSSYFIFNKVKDNKLKAVYIIAITWGNYGYMGWAVLEGAFGAEGFTRGVFFTALWWPILYSGAFLIAKITKVDSNLDIRSYMTNMLVPIASLTLGFIFNLLSIPIYSPIQIVLEKFSAMTSPVILFTVGLSLSIRESFKDVKKAIIPAFLRPALGIILSIIIINILGITDDISRKSIILEASMPVAVLTVVIADMLNLDSRFMTSILILSTLLSVLTVPAVLFFI